MSHETKIIVVKPLVFNGQVYPAGAKLTINAESLFEDITFLPSPVVKAVANGILKDNGDGTFTVIGAVVMTHAGQLYVQGSTFAIRKITDEGWAPVAAPKWIAPLVASGALTIDPGVILVASATLAPFALLVGATQTLVPTVLPANATNKAGVWASSDVTVATVNATGLVTAIKAGTVNITFTTTDGAHVATAVGTITVPVVLPTSVTVSPASPTATIGGTVKLTAAITPAGATDKTGVWTSATPAVATVAQDGTVTGKTAGTSVITFTTNAGAISASRTVTVA